MISSERLQASLGGSWSQVDMRDEGERDPAEAADNSRQHQQWQTNLLDHIDAVQDDVSHRMDFIERELDGKGCNTLKTRLLWPVVSAAFNPLPWLMSAAASCFKLITI